MKCDTCEVEFFGKIISCKCTTYVFCTNACYNQRPFKADHKALCERRSAIAAANKEEEAKLAKAAKRKQAAANRQRDPKSGAWLKAKKEELSPEELAKLVQHNLNVKVSEKVDAIRKNAIDLQDLKPHWKIKCTAGRTDKYAKKDPLIYETVEGGLQVATPDENLELVDGGEGGDNNIYHLEENPIEVTTRQGSLKVFCYICHKKIDTVKESLRCQGKLEDGGKCAEG